MLRQNSRSTAMGKQEISAVLVKENDAVFCVPLGRAPVRVQHLGRFPVFVGHSELVFNVSSEVMSVVSRKCPS